MARSSSVIAPVSQSLNGAETSRLGHVVRPLPASDCAADGHDRLALLFHFGTDGPPDRGLIHSHQPCRGAPDLSITRNLQVALANLGYSVGEFRRAAGNVHPADEYLQRSARRRRAPVLSWDQFNQVISRACSTPFLFGLYAMVPVTDLLTLDLHKPVVFTRCWVACVDPLNATFHAVETNQPVTVQPTDGRFVSASHLRGSSLDDGAYDASVHNADG